MKKCGIFSIFYRNYNYGGQLQAYAMCRALKKLNIDSEQICYVRDKSFLKHKVVVVLKKSWKEKKDLMRRYVNRFIVKLGFGADYARSILHKFNTFIELVPHSKVYRSDSVYDTANDYDVFISGSDQVWNPDTCSDEWYLNFLPDTTKRIAYSASIGKEYFTDAEKQRLKPYIEKYSYIGVREDKAKELIQSFVEKDVDVVLDPVMLLTKEEWAVFDKWDFLKKEKYICVYLVAYNASIEKLALEYARMMNMKAVFITDPRNALNQNPKGYWVPFSDGVGPEEFIALFMNATYIITNSFHGMALSINFEKNFFAYYSRAKDDKNTLNSRIDTVLESFGVKDRLTFTDEKLSTDQFRKEVDYANVRKKVEFRRNECLKLLYEAVVRVDL